MVAFRVVLPDSPPCMGLPLRGGAWLTRLRRRSSWTPQTPSRRPVPLETCFPPAPCLGALRDATRPGGETRHMWSNARGCPRVNGGGPLAVLATSVCSGRGGVRPLSQGGAPPHTPPRRSTRGLLSQGGLPPTPPLDDPLGLPGLGWQAGGCAGWAAGFPRRRLLPIRARGEGAPSGLWWRAWGVCRVGCGVPPQAFALWRAAPAPPHPRPLPQGARGPEAPRRVRLRRPSRTGAWGLGVRCSRRSAGSPRSPR